MPPGGNRLGGKRPGGNRPGARRSSAKMSNARNKEKGLKNAPPREPRFDPYRDGSLSVDHALCREQAAYSRKSCLQGQDYPRQGARGGVVGARPVGRIALAWAPGCYAIRCFL